MAPRAPKPKADDASSTPSPLKPKTEKAKVEKVKVDKPKAGKAKAAKAEKVKLEKVKTEKVAKVEKPKAEKAEKSVQKTREKDGKDGKGEKGEKFKPVTGDEAVELMTAYLKRQNRPYSATEISANLHGKVTKTVADKLLKEMEQNGLIKAKATNGDKKGSQWVFWAIQDPADTAFPEELAAMDTAITMLRESLPGIKSILKILNTKLQTLKSAPTTSELAAMVEDLGKENKEKAEKLKGFKNGSVKMVTREEMDKVDKDFKYWSQKRKARKNAFDALEGALMEGMSREDIWEQLGLEEDVY